MNLEYRDANLDDVKEIIELNQKLFDYEFKNFDNTLDCSWPSKNKDYFEGLVKSENSFLMVVIDGKKVIGYLAGSISESESYRLKMKLAELENILVLKEYRSQGIGKFFYETFINWCKNQNVTKLRVVASVKNEKAINFYKSCGFEDYNLTLERDL
jgi:ribosomal protein S18 acetylase RimI-like enzyme